MAEAAEQRAADKQTLVVAEFVSANQLAQMMNVPVTKVISTCMALGLFVSINQRLDAETITIVSEEFGYKVSFGSAEDVETINEDQDAAEDLQSRRQHRGEERQRPAHFLAFPVGHEICRQR